MENIAPLKSKALNAGDIGIPEIEPIMKMRGK
jgi:hypothetical protein